MPTQKLYFDNSLLFTFEATVLSKTKFKDKPAFILDKTAFYPEGGGQLGDHGIIKYQNQTITIIDTQIDDDGQIYHLTDQALLDELVGVQIQGFVDEWWRRQQMAEHTAQHMLSAVLLEDNNLATISARLAKDTFSIDLGGTDIPTDVFRKAEARVNQNILKDQPLHILFPTPEELATLPLRSRPKVTHDIRLIKIADLDLSPCGGTHCARTGQVGCVRILSSEHIKGMTRIVVKAGYAAFEDYRLKHETLTLAAQSFGCAIEGVADAIQKLQTKTQLLQTEVDQLSEDLAIYRVLQLEHGLASNESKPVPICREYRNTNIVQLRMIANKFTAQPERIIILLSYDEAALTWQIVAQRSVEQTFDVGSWLKNFLTMNGGKGGGTTQRAEGRCSTKNDLMSAIYEDLKTHFLDVIIK